MHKRMGKILWKLESIFHGRFWATQLKLIIGQQNCALSRYDFLGQRQRILTLSQRIQQLSFTSVSKPRQIFIKIRARE